MATVTCSNDKPSAPPPPPDERIAYHASGGNSYTILLMHADGSNSVPLTGTPGRDDRDPELSPDGSRVVFAGTQNGRTQLYLVPATGGTATPLVLDSLDNTQPSWSPDGDRLVFRRTTNTGSSLRGLYVINANGAGLTQLTTDPTDREPAWSPDGLRVAFTSSAGDIWVIDVSGANRTQLTTDAAGEGEPAWSPNGAAIGFTRYVSTSQDILRMDSDGSNIVNLTNTSSLGEAQVAWSPDGLWIAYAGVRGTSVQVLKRRADGTGTEVPLASAAPVSAHPSWRRVQ